MLAVLRIFVVCVCLHHVLARPHRSKHSVQKRWAYIENGDPQMRSIHTDCKKIVREYSDGEMPFYEYTAKIKRCMNRQERNNIPGYDSEYFSPSFSVPGAEKRFETPGSQPMQPENNQYMNYGYDNNYMQGQTNSFGPADTRGNIASPQTPEYGAPQTDPQAQAFPAPNYNYYQQTQPEAQQLTARSEIPSDQEPYQQKTMYSSEIVKKDEIPRPNEH